MLGRLVVLHHTETMSLVEAVSELLPNGALEPLRRRARAELDEARQWAAGLERRQAPGPSVLLDLAAET